MTTPQTNKQTPTLAVLRSKAVEIREALDRHGASNLRVYGSVARGDAQPTSDIDVLVDMEQGRSLLDLAALHLELEELLGHSVEIGTNVSPRLKDRVLAEAVPL